MTAFAVRRLLLSAGVLLAVSLGTFVFIATRFTPTCYSRYSTGAIPTLASTPRQATALWWNWLKGVPSGHSFGQVCGSNIGAPLWPALGHTAALLAATALLVVVFSLALGTVAASRAGSALDVGLRGFSYAAWAIPAFVLALGLQSVFNWAGQHYGFHAFGTTGWPGSCLGQGGVVLPSSLCGPAPTGFTYAADVLRHLVLPSVALAVAFIGIHSRYLRSSLPRARKDCRSGSSSYAMRCGTRSPPSPARSCSTSAPSSALRWRSTGSSSSTASAPCSSPK